LLRSARNDSAEIHGELLTHHTSAYAMSVNGAVEPMGIAGRTPHPVRSPAGAKLGHDTGGHVDEAKALGLCERRP
jgi:hypothetical protein